MPTTKTRIIGEMLKVTGRRRTILAFTADDQLGYTDEEIIDALEKSLVALTPDCLVRTCGDFGHLRVECCEICHSHHPHYEMSLIDIESGGDAWLCCALDRALNPIKHAKMRSSSEYKEIERMFRPDDSH